MSFSRLRSTNLPQSGLGRAERLAAALELQRVREGADGWIAHVLGVHDDGQHLWVQIAPHPDGSHSVVLRLSTAATPRHALATLATLPREALGCFPVVPVMCTV